MSRYLKKKNEFRKKKTGEELLNLNKSIVLSGYVTVSDGAQDSFMCVAFITNNFTY